MTSQGFRHSIPVTAVSAAAAALALGYAQLALPEQPLISDYVLVSGGLVPVVLGMLSFAVACLSLAYGLAVHEPARTAATRVLLLAAAGGLMLTAVFPTDPGGGALNTWPGEIHRWAAAVVFTTLPVAGWALARGRATLPRWNLVRAMSATSALALAVYLAAHPASVTSSLIGGASYYGLLERGLVLAEIALVVVMAAASRQLRGSATAEPALSAPEPPAVKARVAA
ncbi:DUF998 domain-containing protein [Nonomuraea sp. NPDC000554]|uniref:DUF998 domain-containing protein n=1 Tax=Nonomuraea sp. NPDC000554 TaxID=3154259 RepID=UPI00331CD591